MEEQKWEYCILDVPKISPEKIFNELGEAGWELVAVICTVPPLGATAFFKKSIR